MTYYEFLQFFEHCSPDTRVKWVYKHDHSVHYGIVDESCEADGDELDEQACLLITDDNGNMPILYAWEVETISVEKENDTE